MANMPAAAAVRDFVVNGGSRLPGSERDGSGVNLSGRFGSELERFRVTGRPYSAIVRRRPTPQQGRALEILGHAIEYLVDSELRFGDTVGSRDTAEAAQLLMGLSREVFAECAEVVPVGQRLRSCLTNMFGRPELQVQVQTDLGYERAGGRSN